jgi:hypothetical protein
MTSPIFNDFQNVQNVNINVMQAIMSGSAGTSFAHFPQALDI